MAADVIGWVDSQSFYKKVRVDAPRHFSIHLFNKEIMRDIIDNGGIEVLLSYNNNRSKRFLLPMKSSHWGCVNIDATQLFDIMDSEEWSKKTPTVDLFVRDWLFMMPRVRLQRVVRGHNVTSVRHHTDDYSILISNKYFDKLR
jgi:hypothetical protein